MRSGYMTIFYGGMAEEGGGGDRKAGRRFQRVKHIDIRTTVLYTIASSHAEKLIIKGRKSCHIFYAL